jgi:cobalamin biosynthesis protein CobT
MDYLTIIAGTVALAALVGMAWLGGYELGQATGADRERDMTKPRIEGLLNELNKYKPRARAPKRRARK